MSLIRHYTNSRLTLIGMLSALLVLAIGCSQKSTGIDTPTTFKTIKNPINTASLPSSIDETLSLIQSSKTPQRENYILHGASLYLKQKDYIKSQQLLDRLKLRELPKSTLAQYLIIQSTLSLQNKQTDRALRALTTNQFGLFDFYNQLDTQTQIDISRLKAEAYEASGNFLAATKERIFYGPLIKNSSLGFNKYTDKNNAQPPSSPADSPDAIQLNNEAIWHNLMTIPKVQLGELASAAMGNDYKGWLELAHLYKTYEDNLELQVEKINAWTRLWSRHTAVIHPPGILKALQSAAPNRPKHIALLLPGSGKFEQAALAIQGGFMSAHFSTQSLRRETRRDSSQHMRNNNSQPPNEAPSISIYDSSTYSDVMEAYNQAVKEGAEVVIGPLEKENVTRLSVETNLPVPILALNYAGDEKPKSPSLLQFGLRAEDEAKQVAQRAWMDGFRQAAVLFPNSEWGYRIQQAFIDQWLTLGGVIVAQAQLSTASEFSQQIKQMLKLEESAQRARSLQNQLERPVEFLPTRRQDIEFIFLASNPEQARQIKPTLNFHYASDIPVYAVSTIFEGNIDAERDKDIDGVRFVETPWVLSNDDTLKIQSENIWQELPPSQQRLHALGIDAYRLISRLQIMTTIPNSALQGATGILTLDKNQQFTRKLLWVQISNGVPELIPLDGHDGNLNSLDKTQRNGDPRFQSSYTQ